MRFPTAPYGLHDTNRSSCSVHRGAKRRPGNYSHVGKAAGAGQASVFSGSHAGLPIRKIHGLGSTELVELDSTERILQTFVFSSS